MDWIDIIEISDEDLEQILREEGMGGELPEGAKDLLWPWRNVKYEDNY